METWWLLSGLEPRLAMIEGSPGLAVQGIGDCTADLEATRGDQKKEHYGNDNYFFSNGNIGWTVAHWPPWVLFSFVFNNCMNVLLNKTLMCNFRSVCFYNCKLFMLSSNNAGPIFCNYSFPTKYNICQHRLSGFFHENAKIPRSPKGALSTSHCSVLI